MRRCGWDTKRSPTEKRSAFVAAAMKLWIDGAIMARLKTKYLNDVVPAMMKEFSYKNSMQVPRLAKITLNVGVGEATQNAKARSEEHTSELQSPYVISYAVFCLKKK